MASKVRAIVCHLHPNTDTIVANGIKQIISMLANHLNLFIMNRFRQLA